MPIRIALKLEVVAGMKVIVPGQEPASDITSRVLLAQLDSTKVMADVKDVLAAIPGSRLVFGDNWSGGGSHAGRRRVWLELPPQDQDCRCDHPDYYEIIRGLAHQETPVEEKFAACDLVGQGMCPSEWNADVGPAVDDGPDNYRREGESPYGATGILPILPPWYFKGNRISERP